MNINRFIFLFALIFLLTIFSLLIEQATVYSFNIMYENTICFDDSNEVIVPEIDKIIGNVTEEYNILIDSTTTTIFQSLIPTTIYLNSGYNYCFPKISDAILNIPPPNFCNL